MIDGGVFHRTANKTEELERVKEASAKTQRVVTQLEASISLLRTEIQSLRVSEF